MSKKRGTEIPHEYLARVEASGRPLDEIQPEWIDPNDLVLNDENPRIIRDSKFKKLVEDMERDPQYISKRPIIARADTKVILAGNMRARAAMTLGWKYVPVQFTNDFDEDHNREVILKDNAHAGEYNWDMIANLYDPKMLDRQNIDVWQTDVDFSPTFDPETSNKDTDQKHIDDAQDRHDNYGGDGTPKPAVKIVCPHCGEDFEVSHTDY